MRYLTIPDNPSELGADCEAAKFAFLHPEVSEYRLGNRSALEWIVDQYPVSTDKRSGIVNDPNREDDPEYIVRLIGQVIHVSLETVKRTRELATLALLPEVN